MLITQYLIDSYTSYILKVYIILVTGLQMCK